MHSEKNPRKSPRIPQTHITVYVRFFIGRIPLVRSRCVHPNANAESVWRIEIVLQVYHPMSAHLIFNCAVFRRESSSSLPEVLVRELEQREHLALEKATPPVTARSNVYPEHRCGLVTRPHALIHRHHVSATPIPPKKRRSSTILSRSLVLQDHQREYDPPRRM